MKEWPLSKAYALVRKQKSIDLSFAKYQHESEAVMFEETLKSLRNCCAGNPDSLDQNLVTLAAMRTQEAFASKRLQDFVVSTTEDIDLAVLEPRCPA